MTIDLGAMDSLLDAPAPAVLTTYRRDGSAASSPVWFRRVGDTLEVVIADGDVKERHLARRSDCSLLIFETVAPYRGLRVEGVPELDRAGVTEARREISRRYLGDVDGDSFTAGRGPGMIVRFRLADSRRWDLAAVLPH